MKRFKLVAAVFAASAAVFAGSFAGCNSSENLEETTAPRIDYTQENPDVPSDDITTQPELDTPEVSEPEVTEPETEQPKAEQPKAEQPKAEEPKAEEPQEKTVTYISVTTDGVNIRSGAGTSYSVRGTAQKSTLYALDGSSDGWYKTAYRSQAGYISSKYCEFVHMRASTNAAVEAVVEEGLKYLGTPYVYGATRYMDSNGKKLSGFSTNAFDCSSLMQYIFKMGAGVNLDVNTRTQIYQGKTVKKSELQRGDLMFFTNASRKNLSGIERVGHVALYLGDNYILHTASDFAKIEQISSTRWSYFIQGQRIL